jgi:hypothetical protein
MGKSCPEPYYRDRGVMFKQFKKRFLFYGVYLAASAFLLTCGIEEYYYLPQVPEINIRTEFNTLATINLPSLTGYYYAQNYKIYYRIYISGANESGTIDTQPIRNTISSTLAGDFAAIEPNTDPTSTSAGTPADILFKNRNYFELALFGENVSNLLTPSGGNVRIFFPTIQGGIPLLSLNNGPEYPLYRASELIQPVPDRYFRNTSDLSAPEKATADINADVASRTGLSQRYAYVSMYIVAVGSDQSAFTQIYSKPTHISVFRLPDN